MTTTNKIVTLNVYRTSQGLDGEWCYSLWIGGDFDSSDVIGGIDHDCNHEEARRAAIDSLRDGLAPHAVKVDYSRRNDNGKTIYSASWQVEA